MYSSNDPGLQRIARRLRLDGTCWVYDACNCGRGYRQITVNGQRWPAHRYVYEQLVGPISPKHDIDHLCRNRACVNPMHLEAVTRLVSLQRGPSTSVARGWVMKRFPHEHDTNATYKTGRKADWPRCQQCIDFRNRNFVPVYRHCSGCKVPFDPPRSAGNYCATCKRARRAALPPEARYTEADRLRAKAYYQLHRDGIKVRVNARYHRLKAVGA